MAQPNFRFEEFELNVDSCELRRSGVSLKVERIPMELLLLLLQNSGKLVRREVINEKLWGDGVFIEAEHGINTAINKLRATLRDDSRDPRFIRTVVGRGYCFIAEVKVVHSVERVPEVDAHSLSVSKADAPVGSNGYSSAAHAHALHIEDSPTVVSNTVENGHPEPKIPFSPPPDGQKDAGHVARGKRRHAWLLISALLLLVVAGTAFVLFRQRPERRIPADRILHSVAVLPFRNLAPDSDQDYLVDGMTDQLITQLGKNSSLRVISYGSVMQYKGVQVPMREIAETLDVDAVLEGSFLHNGTQVRITADLIDARNDRHLWAQVYEEGGNDLLTIQESVTNDIVRDVALALGSGVSTSQVRPLNVEARDSYLRGRFLWNKRTPASLEKSVVYYQNAINADPGYAEAYAALGIAYVVLTGYGSDPSSSLAKAQLAAEAALRLGGGEAEAAAEAHTVLGAVKTERDRDWPGAEVEYRRALELDPDQPAGRLLNDSGSRKLDLP